MTAAKTQPITTPTRMPNRPSSPGPTTVTSRIETSVTVAISGCDSKEPTAVGARLRPISATDGACHYRRHDGVDDPAADQTHGDADQHQHDADGHDGTELRGRARSCRRCQRGDEREGRTEIARDPAPGDEQEQRGADTREQQRRRDGEAGDGRNQQCRSEHRDDVLHPDSDGARPTQSFVRRHDGSVGDPLAVSVDSPADSRRPRSLFLVRSQVEILEVRRSCLRPRPTKTSSADCVGRRFARCHRITGCQHRRRSRLTLRHGD